MNLKRIVSKNLRRLRQQSGWTQGQVARKAGQTVSMVSMAERGIRCPDLNALPGYAKAYGIHPAWLLIERDKNGKEKRS